MYKWLLHYFTLFSSLTLRSKKKQQFHIEEKVSKYSSKLEKKKHRFRFYLFNFELRNTFEWIRCVKKFPYYLIFIRLVLNVNLLSFFNYWLPAIDCKCSLLIKSKKNIRKKKKKNEKRKKNYRCRRYTVSSKNKRKIYVWTNSFLLLLLLLFSILCI